MTAIEEARAALAKWDRSSFPDAGYAYLAESLRTLIAEYERLSVPPSDDEREALARVIRENRSIAKIMSDGYVSVIQAGDDEITDAILASDVWRNRRQGPITDEMVERACIAFTCDSAEEWFELAATYRASIWSGMRAALEAAERARSDVPSTTEQESYR